MGISASARKSGTRETETAVTVYKRPPKSACDVHHYPVPFDDEGLARYVWVQWLYRKYVVHFSIEVQVRESADAEDWRTVYRIDTSDGTVHEHRFWRDSKENRREIETIPTDTGWSFVTEWFDKAMDICEDAWPDRIKEWMK